MKRKNFSLLTVFFLTASAQTQADFYPHVYNGIGYSEVDRRGLCTGTVERDLDLALKAASSSSCSEHGSSRKFYAGLRWTEYLAAEASYHYLASVKRSFHIESGDDDYLRLSDEIETKLLNIFIVSHLPLTDNISLFGKLGGGLWDSEFSERLSSHQFIDYPFIGSELSTHLADKEDDGNGSHWGYGFGIDYRYGKLWTFRAEWEAFSGVNSDDLGGDFDVEATSLSLNLRF